MSWTRIGAIFAKELRDYRRNRFIMITMALMPAIFIVLPIVDIFILPAVRPGSAASSALDRRIGLSLLYMLIIPAMVPATLAGYSVVGEREQGTLEPVLTTPIRPEEFLLGKALAVLLPTLSISYLMFGVFLACVKLFAQPDHRDGGLQRPARARPAALHAAARRLVDLGRPHDLGRARATCASPSSSACSPACRRSPWRGCCRSA